MTAQKRHYRYMAQQDAIRFPQLDGLRGWAAVIVVLNHIFPNFLLSNLRFPPTSGLLSDISGGLIGWLINVASAIGIGLYCAFLDGALAVRIFFVLSGFVLSIAAIERRSQTIVYSQAIRRYVRLTIPIVATTLLAASLMAMGLMRNAEIPQVIGGGWIDKFYRFPASLDGALQFALFDVYFDYKPSTSYNFATWTMSFELAGSFLIFAILLARGRARMVAYLIAAVVCIFLSPNLLCFIAGAVIAEISVRNQFVWPDWARIVIIALSPLLIIEALILGKIHQMFIVQLCYLFLAVEVVALVLTVKPVGQLMQSRISDRLGTLTYPLYLSHPIVLCSAGAWLTIVLSPHSHLTCVVCGLLIFALCIGFAAFLQPIESLAIWASRSFAGLLLAKNSPSRRNTGMTKDLWPTSEIENAHLKTAAVRTDQQTPT